MSFAVSGEAYDRFMGRYSSPLARGLVDALDLAPDARALDVGCGPGALTAVLVDRLGAERVTAIDPSPPFVEACRARHPGVDVRQGTADALPFADDSFDVAAANLVVHFMPDPVAGLAQMARVTRPGGRLAVTVWDLAGARAPMAPVWRHLTPLLPDLPDEGGMPGGTAGEIWQFLTAAGLTDVTETELAVTVTHATFEEWWEPYLHRVGPIGEVFAALSETDLDRLAAACREELGDGPFEITAVAFLGTGRA